MKHLKTGRKFSREKKQREALLRIMLGDLLLKGKMKTTLAKAKELKMLGDKMIGQLKRPEGLRVLRGRLPRNVNSAAIRDLAEKTASRKSGYTRIVKLGARRSDSAQMAIIEIIKDAIETKPVKDGSQEKEDKSLTDAK